MSDSKLFEVPIEATTPLSSFEHSPNKRLMIFSGRSNQDLAQRISERLGVGLGQTTLKTFANGEITHYLRDHGYAIKVPPTWRDLYASGQKLLRQGVDAAEVPGRLGIRAERWEEICGACSVRVVALGVELVFGELEL